MRREWKHLRDLLRPLASSSFFPPKNSHCLLGGTDTAAGGGPRAGPGYGEGRRGSGEGTPAPNPPPPTGLIPCITLRVCPLNPRRGFRDGQRKGLQPTFTYPAESINTGDAPAPGLQQEGWGVCLLSFNQDDPKSNRNVWRALEEPRTSLPE